MRASESAVSVSMCSGLNELGRNQDCEGVDFFQALVVSDEKSGFALDRRCDLQSIRQANTVTCPHQGRDLGELFVDGEQGKRREGFQREFDFIDESVLFLGERFSENFCQRDSRGDRAQTMTAQEFKHRFE